MVRLHDLPEAFDRDGFAIVPNVLTVVQIDRLRSIGETGAALRRGGSAYGSRNLLDSPAVRDLAAEGAIRALVEPIVGASAIPVRALFFDKTAEANWPVLWHQDLTIAVADKQTLEGWGAWSIKAGIPHVEPPSGLVAQMLTIRLHLDDCGADNGPLRVIPRSHALGRLSRERIRAITATTDETTCVAPKGSALLMRQLLLHASSPAKRPTHRRVVHIEFAPAKLLPPPLKWASAQAFALAPGIA